MSLEVLQQRFIDLIALKTGLRIRVQDQAQLLRRLHTRQQAQSLQHLDDYYQLLLRETGAAQQEWEQLASLITTGESYFYRDRGQIDILREQILPSLIQRKEGQGQPTLNLWSAGCSSGEEVYTLAILLQELLPNPTRWSLRILGTDLNPVAIQKAKRGRYKDWSFRQTTPDFRARHFQQQERDWVISDRLKQHVQFRQGNLLDPEFWPLVATPQGWDLIICRNVFIYFSAIAIQQTLARFHTALAPKGYLMVGHAELQGQSLEPYRLLNYPGSLVYQRPGDLAGATSHPHPPMACKPAQTSSALSDRKAQPSNPPQRSAPHAPNSSPVPSVQPFLQLERAQVLHQAGHLAAAIAICQQQLQTNPTCVPTLSLRADIALKQQDFQAAKQLFRKILYLEPDNVSAILATADLHLQNNRPDRAYQTLDAAGLLRRQVPRSLTSSETNQLDRIRRQLAQRPINVSE